MAQADVLDAQESYNSTAVRISGLLSKARESAARPTQRERPVAERFPALHRPGLGVALEYERMGNRPVSDDLEGRAAQFNIRFEHLGITLGTILHGVDLRTGLSEAKVRFVRDCLLERKVIFFRDQHLSEDEQVAFGRLFGELDAFPFGVSHPLLRTHPETGKTALYLHGGFLRHDSLYDERDGVALEREQALKLVALLLRQHEAQEYLCRFHWAPGSIAFWDNRAVQHYAASDYFPHRRMIRRVTVSGDVPYYDKNQEE